MDILTHTLSGIAIGTTVISFSNNKFRNKLGIIGLAGFGSALPDIDAISLWSKFDSTIGKFFGLENSGKEIYFSKFWYSHHGFLHSLFAGLLIAIIFSLLFYLIKTKLKGLSISGFTRNIGTQKYNLISFISGLIIHLIEDMPTPNSVWGGVNFFWPSKSYIGGTGDIWWWNNYDIFLIVVGVIVLNGIILTINKAIRYDLRKLTAVVFILGVTLSVFQIKSREFDFNYYGYTQKYQQFELKSKEIQKQILGKNLFNTMVKFDNKIPVNF